MRLPEQTSQTEPTPLTALTGTLLILGANARLTGDLDRILQSQGIAPPPLTIVAPSLFLWLMLGAAVVGFAVFTVVGRRVSRHGVS